MPLDPSVIYGGRSQQSAGGQALNPFDLINSLQQMKSNQQQIQQNEGALETQKLAQQKARQALADDAKIDGIVQRWAKPDGSLDTDNIMADMEREGMSAQVFALKKQTLDWMKTDSEAKKVTIENNAALIHTAAGLVQSFLANVPEPDQPRKFGELKASITKLVGPEFAATLGETPDATHLRQLADNDAPTYIAKLKQEGDTFDRALKVMERAQAATTEARTLQNDIPKRIKDLMGLGSEALSKQDNPTDYADRFSRFSTLAKAMLPSEAQSQVLGSFVDPQSAGFSMQAAKEQARKAGLTQNEVSTEADRKVGRELERERLAFERAKDSRVTSGGDPEVIAGYIDQLKKGNLLLSGIPAKDRDDVAKALRAQGVNIERLSAGDLAMKNQAQSILPMIDKAAELAQKISDLKLMGTIGGRWRSLISKESSASDLKGLTDDQKKLVGEFAAQTSLLLTGIARAHGGARAGGSIQLVEHLSRAMDAMNKDLPTFLGNLQGERNFMEMYAHLGEKPDTPPGTPAAPAGGAKAYPGEVKEDAQGRTFGLVDGKVVEVVKAGAGWVVK